MNKTNQTIETEIRAMLADYYSGQSGAGMEERLIGLLESLQPLPADLEHELELLHLMRFDAKMQDASVVVPSDLENRLRADIHKYAVAERKHSFRHLLYGWSAAASVALLLGVAVSYVAKVEVNLSEHKELAVAATDTANHHRTAVKNIRTESVAAKGNTEKLKAETQVPVHVAKDKNVIRQTPEILSPTQYSATKIDDCEQIESVLNQCREDATETGEEIAINLQEAMSDVNLTLASIINESRTAGVTLYDSPYADDDGEILQP